MTVDVRPEVLIHRPRAEVAAVMFDPANDLRWTGGITSSRPDQPVACSRVRQSYAAPSSWAAASTTATSSQLCFATW